MRRSLAMAVTMLAVSMAGTLRAGVVMLADGRTVEGTVSLVAVGDGKVNVQPTGKAVMSVPIADVRMATLSQHVDGPSKECDGVRWARMQVGPGQKAGLADINGKSVTIRDSSEGFRLGQHRMQRRDNNPPPPGTFCFVFQKLTGDGEITARVAPSDPGSKCTRAGLVICEGLDGAGPMAMISRTADPMGATLLQRLSKNEGTTLAADNRVIPAASPWLKLTRTGTSIKTYESVDGVRWMPVADIKLNLDERAGVYIGVAATGNFRDGRANFDGIILRGKRVEADVSGMQDTRLPDAHTVLTDGSILAGIVESASSGQIKLRKPASLGGDVVTVSASGIIRSQFAPLTRAQTERLATAAAGLLTRDGDFLEGEVKDLQAESATVSSVAFGLTTMERARTVAVAFSAPPADGIAPGLIEVHLVDGSMVMARKLTVDKDQLVMDEPVLGTLKTPIKEVVSFEKRGG